MKPDLMREDYKPGDTVVLTDYEVKLDPKGHPLYVVYIPSGGEVLVVDLHPLRSPQWNPADLTYFDHLPAEVKEIMGNMLVAMERNRDPRALSLEKFDLAYTNHPPYIVVMQDQQPRTGSPDWQEILSIPDDSPENWVFFDQLVFYTLPLPLKTELRARMGLLALFANKYPGGSHPRDDSEFEVNTDASEVLIYALTSEAGKYPATGVPWSSPPWVTKWTGAESDMFSSLPLFTQEEALRLIAAGYEGGHPHQPAAPPPPPSLEEDEEFPGYSFPSAPLPPPPHPQDIGVEAEGFPGYSYPGTPEEGPTPEEEPAPEEKPVAPETPKLQCRATDIDDVMRALSQAVMTLAYEQRKLGAEITLTGLGIERANQAKKRGDATGENEWDVIGRGHDKKQRHRIMLKDAAEQEVADRFSNLTEVLIRCLPPRRLGDLKKLMSSVLTGMTRLMEAGGDMTRVRTSEEIWRDLSRIGFIYDFLPEVVAEFEDLTSKWGGRQEPAEIEWQEAERKLTKAWDELTDLLAGCCGEETPSAPTPPPAPRGPRPEVKAVLEEIHSGEPSEAMVALRELHQDLGAITYELGALEEVPPPLPHDLPECVRGTENACKIEAKERIVKYGSAVLTTAELISVALGIPEASAAKLLEEHGGVIGLFKAPVGALLRAKGVGKALALRVKAIGELSARIEASPFENPGIIVQTPEDLAPLVRPFRLREEESFWLALLNARNRVIGIREVCRGTVDACHIHPRDIFSVALLEKATAVILVHNHPSGNPRPSTDDLTLTRRMRRGAALLGIRLLDHLIVAGDQVVSVRALGFWDKLEEE